MAVNCGFRWKCSQESADISARECLTGSGSGTTLEEDEAMAIALDEVAAHRRERRTD
jgi:hypothetical protein